MPDPSTPPSGSQTLTLTGSATTVIGQDLSLSVAGQATGAVAHDTQLSVGRKLRIEAADEITLVVGQASLVMKKDGTIVLSGKNITLDASAKINVKASGDVVVKGRKIQDN